MNMERNVFFCIFLFNSELTVTFYTFWLTQIFSMFSKQRKFQSSQKVTHFRVWLKKNRRKTKKWFVSFKFDWILVMKSYKFNFYHFSLHEGVQREFKRSWGLNYLRWRGGIERWAQCRMWLLRVAEDILGAVTFPPSLEFHFQLISLIPYSAIAKTNPRHIPYFSYFYPCGKSTFKQRFCLVMCFIATNYTYNHDIKTFMLNIISIRLK